MWASGASERAKLAPELWPGDAKCARGNVVEAMGCEAGKGEAAARKVVGVQQAGVLNIKGWELVTEGGHHARVRLQRATHNATVTSHKPKAKKATSQAACGRPNPPYKESHGRRADSLPAPKNRHT